MLIKAILWLLDPYSYERRYGDIVIMEGRIGAPDGGRVQLRRIPRSQAARSQLEEHYQHLNTVDRKQI